VPAFALYLDSNVFISYLEGNAADSVLLKGLFEALLARPGVGVTSELTLAEVLVGSDKKGPHMKRAYLDLIVWSKGFVLSPVTRGTLHESADLCSAHKQFVGRKLRLLDAIHLATAVQSKCRYFVSADRAIATPADMTKVDFERSAIEGICKALA
jgi:predicted nucleic acid-binding protein